MRQARLISLQVLFIWLRDDMNRESVYLGCVILMMAAISAASAQDGTSSNNASAKLEQNQAAIFEGNMTAPKCNDSINKPQEIKVGGAKDVSCINPAMLPFAIARNKEILPKKAYDAGLPAETVMDLSGLINIESMKPIDRLLAIVGDGEELLQNASKLKLPAETIMDLSATVLPRWKIHNL
jgi:hypothetical protein